MKKFWKQWDVLIVVLVIGLPLLYYMTMSMGRQAAKMGCHRSLDYDGSYQARVFCNNKADTITWGWKSDFEGLGKVYTYDRAAEIYVIKGEK